MNQQDKRQELTLVRATAEDRTASLAAVESTSLRGNSPAGQTNTSRGTPPDDAAAEMNIFRDVLEELTPRGDEKIKRETQAIKAFRKRLATLLKQGVTPDAMYGAAVAKGFKISKNEFNKIVRSITHPRPRISRAKSV